MRVHLRTRLAAVGFVAMMLPFSPAQASETSLAPPFDEAHPISECAGFLVTSIAVDCQHHANASLDGDVSLLVSMATSSDVPGGEEGRAQATFERTASVPTAGDLEIEVGLFVEEARAVVEGLVGDLSDGRRHGTAFVRASVFIFPSGCTCPQGVRTFTLVDSSSEHTELDDEELRLVVPVSNGEEPVPAGQISVAVVIWSSASMPFPEVGRSVVSLDGQITEVIARVS